MNCLFPRCAAKRCRDKAHWAYTDAILAFVSTGSNVGGWSPTGRDAPSWYGRGSTYSANELPSEDDPRWAIGKRIVAQAYAQAPDREGPIAKWLARALGGKTFDWEMAMPAVANLNASLLLGVPAEMISAEEIAPLSQSTREKWLALLTAEGVTAPRMRLGRIPDRALTPYDFAGWATDFHRSSWEKAIAIIRQHEQCDE